MSLPAAWTVRLKKLDVPNIALVDAAVARKLRRLFAADVAVDVAVGAVGCVAEVSDKVAMVSNDMEGEPFCVFKGRKGGGGSKIRISCHFALSNLTRL